MSVQWEPRSMQTDWRTDRQTWRRWIVCLRNFANAPKTIYVVLLFSPADGTERLSRNIGNATPTKRRPQVHRGGSPKYLDIWDMWGKTCTVWASNAGSTVAVEEWVVSLRTLGSVSHTFLPTRHNQQIITLPKVRNTHEFGPFLIPWR